MTGWYGALDLQLELAEWMASETGQRFGGGYFASYFQSGNARTNWTDEDTAYRAGMSWARASAATIFNAEPIFVEPEMMTVLESAVAGFQPEPLDEKDFITPNGLLILPRSLSLRDLNDKLITWRAASWAPYRAGGIQLVLYHDHHDAAATDDFDDAYLSYSDTGNDPATLELWNKMRAAPLMPTHVVNWAFGEAHPGIAQADGGFGAESAMTVQRQFQGILRLLLQHLADRAQARPPRAFAKRAAKAKLPHEHVTVVRLRRPAQDRQPDEPSVVHWSHRWIVGGHWRNQYYPSQGIHRQIWISPYVKGPEELELVVNKARVFALVR